MYCLFTLGAAGTIQALRHKDIKAADHHPLRHADRTMTSARKFQLLTASSILLKMVSYLLLVVVLVVPPRILMG